MSALMMSSQHHTGGSGSVSRQAKEIKDIQIEKEKIKKEVLSAEERQEIKYNTFAQKVLAKSNGKIKALSYINSKEKVNALCLECGYKWNLRADHLLERCKCPICRNNK